ncbi:MAG TPA: nitrilase-related carbon-nitrogen hydrolase [Solirubrobacteraceae bacterium]|jgi:predicted amidohydrolase|nr:nitrilase-related carbon-nitrogen hydrolase [Solirubrobacteraceae bacterium]
MSSPVSVAIVQMTGVPYEARANRRRSVRRAEYAFATGAQIVVLPEMVVPGYALDPARLRGVAEDIEGETVQAWLAAADAAGGYVVGGLCERDGDRLYNTAVIVGDGRLLLHYRKLHLFGPEKTALRPGDRGLPVVRTRLGTLGVCICYDLRFVEALRILTLQGADLVCVPTAWVTGFDATRHDGEGMPPQAHGAVLQAGLNQVFVACASQVGRPGEFDLLGGSLIADPYGRRLCGPLSGADEDFATVELDLTAARRAQDRGGHIQPRSDRRSDVYGVVIEGRVL